MKFTIIALVFAIFCFATTTAQGAGGYQPIQWNQNNQQLVDVLDFGLDEILPQAISAGQLAQGTWTWTKVNSVESQVVVGTNYAFNVYISDGQGATAMLDFVVNEYVSLMTLTSYNVNLASA